MVVWAAEKLLDALDDASSAALRLAHSPSAGLNVISALLTEKGRTALDPKWVIVPVGGLDKIPTFVALLGAKLNVAFVMDYLLKDSGTASSARLRRACCSSQTGMSF